MCPNYIWTRYLKHFLCELKAFKLPFSLSYCISFFSIKFLSIDFFFVFVLFDFILSFFLCFFPFFNSFICLFIFIIFFTDSALRTPHSALSTQHSALRTPRFRNSQGCLLSRENLQNNGLKNKKKDKIVTYGLHRQCR